MSELLHEDLFCEPDASTLLSFGASLATVLVTLAALVLAVFLSFFLPKKNKKIISSDEESVPIYNQTDTYLSARSSQGLLASTLSLFATALGTWAVTGFPEVAAYSGWGGLIGYVAACIIPWFVLALLAPHILRAMGGRGYTSLDFLLDRFGVVMYTIGAVLSIATGFLSLTASYTAVGGAVSNVTNNFHPLWVIVPLALCTLGYSLFAGLPGSIFSDKLQAVGLLLITTVLATGLYVVVGREGITWNKFTEATVPVEGANPTTTALVLIFSVVCVEALNQNCWQRMYSAKSTKVASQSLLLASAFLVPVYIMFGTFGFTGKAARDEGLICLPIGSEWASFYALVTLMKSGWKIVAVILSVTMSTSSVDSTQSSLLAMIGAPIVAKGWSLHWGRGIVAFINIPAILLAATDPPSIMTLFMVGNILSATVFPYLVIGLSSLVSRAGAISGVLSGFLSVVTLGYIYLDAEEYGPLRGFKWITFPEPYGFYSSECLITFIVCPLTSGLVGLFVSFIQQLIFKETISEQQKILEEMRQPKTSPSWDSTEEQDEDSQSAATPESDEDMKFPLEDKKLSLFHEKSREEVERQL